MVEINFNGFLFREQLLIVLLRITSVVLSMAPPSERDKSLGGRLAEHIFKV
jgi:hypothetical protein